MDGVGAHGQLVEGLGAVDLASGLHRSVMLGVLVVLHLVCLQSDAIVGAAVLNGQLRLEDVDLPFCLAGPLGGCITTFGGALPCGLGSTAALTV